MKRRPAWLFLLLSIPLLLNGCVPSLHPLYTEKDLVFRADLLGTWTDPESSETWQFSREGEKSYRMVYTDRENKRGEFVVHLVNVQNRLFLDLFPAASSFSQNDFYRIHLVPAHTFAWVRQIGSSLQLSFLDPNWISDYLNEHPETVRHHRLRFPTGEEEIVFTARPAELQSFLLRLTSQKEAFSLTANLERVKGGQSD